MAKSQNKHFLGVDLSRWYVVVGADESFEGLGTPALRFFLSWARLRHW